MSVPAYAKELTVENHPIAERIRQRAHELYVQRGGQLGSELDDWLQAETEIGRQDSRTLELSLPDSFLGLAAFNNSFLRAGRGFMLIGKRFTLERSMVAVEIIGGKRRAVNIPVGAMLKVVSGPSIEGPGMINVFWEDRKVAIFSVDLKARGTEITDRRAKA